MTKDNSVTIAKGIGIILMVIGHSGLGGYTTNFIYLFHMPLFFFLSGYCFKETYLNDAKTFVWKRIKGAYWPYVKWSLLFLAFHNVFTLLHIYETPYSLREFAIKAVHITTGIWDSEQLLGGFWFLKSLFWGSLIFYGIRKICDNRLKLAMGGVILLLSAVWINYKNWHVPYWGINETDLYAAFFMLVGNKYSKKSIRIGNVRLFFYLGIALMLVGMIFWPQQLTIMKWQTMIPYALTAVIGSAYVLRVGKWLNSKHTLCTTFLTYTGENTMNILIWHFLCFKLVSLIIIEVYLLSNSHLSEFPTIGEYSHNGWWIMYAFEGIVIPLLCTCIFERIKNKNI